MFFHYYKYACLRLMRNKTELFWMLAFPMILGTLFNVAFGNLYKTAELFSEIPVTVVTDKSVESNVFDELITSLSGGDNPLLKADYTDKEEAMKLLKDGDTDGVIIVENGEATLTVTQSDINQTIIKNILDRYKINRGVMIDTLNNNPQNFQAVVDAMELDTKVSNEVSLGGNMDFFVQYFFNLLAMVCILSANAGMSLAIDQQANLSVVGARRNLSSYSKLPATVADYLAAVTVNFVILILVFLYLLLVLGIDFGSKIPEILIASFVGTAMGVSMGFFVGSIGNMSEKTKSAVVMSVSLGLCCVSGLMADNIPKIINEKCPIINQINPVGIITNCFYSLCVYGSLDMFYKNIIKLVIISMLFIFGGFIITRRKKYASL